MSGCVILLQAGELVSPLPAHREVTLLIVFGIKLWRNGSLGRRGLMIKGWSLEDRVVGSRGVRGLENLRDCGQLII